MTIHKLDMLCVDHWLEQLELNSCCHGAPVSLRKVDISVARVAPLFQLEIRILLFDHYILSNP